MLGTVLSPGEMMIQTTTKTQSGVCPGVYKLAGEIDIDQVTSSKCEITVVGMARARYTKV